MTCDYNILQFTREMEIATKLCHPNLLLFIGTTREGEPVILTELMPSSLCKELEKRDAQCFFQGSYNTSGISEAVSAKTPFFRYLTLSG